jgi:hypothetical protein
MRAERVAEQTPKDVEQENRTVRALTAGTNHDRAGVCNCPRVRQLRLAIPIRVRRQHALRAARPLWPRPSMTANHRGRHVKQIRVIELLFLSIDDRIPWFA